MGRTKKGGRIPKDNLWIRAGGKDNIVSTLSDFDILKKETCWTSETWQELSVIFFGINQDRYKKWLYTIWHQNRRGVRTSVTQSTINTGAVNVDEGLSQSEEDTAAAESEMDAEAEGQLEDTAAAESEMDAEAEGQLEDTAAAETEMKDAASAESEDDNDKDGTGISSEYRTTQPGPKVFKMKIKREKWDKIKPSTGSSKLKKSWTHVFYSSFRKHNPCCALAFKYMHLRAPKSKKKTSAYLKIKAIFTFSSCKAKYLFQIRNKPSKNTKKLQFMCPEQVKFNICRGKQEQGQPAI